MAITTAKGTLVQKGSGGSPETYTTIGQVRSITGPAVVVDKPDITTHSTAGNWRKKIGVLIDPGDLSFPINFDHVDATHAFATGLWADLTALFLRDFKIVFPASAGTLTFHAYVTRHEFMAPVDNVLSVNIALSVTDAITGT